MKPAFSVCVYCGSRPGVDPVFVETARAVGRWIGQHGGQLVYGGGNSGLREAGGRVVGVIPSALVDKEFARHECDELFVVETMHQRKQIMAERADAFLALPGGIGTFEELFEVWTWRQLKYHDKPIGILDVGGYYAPLMTFLRASVGHGFMNDWQMGLVRCGEDAPALLAALVEEAGAKAPADLSRI